MGLRRGILSRKLHFLVMMVDWLVFRIPELEDRAVDASLAWPIGIVDLRAPNLTRRHQREASIELPPKHPAQDNGRHQTSHSPPCPSPSVNTNSPTHPPVGRLPHPHLQPIRHLPNQPLIPFIHKEQATMGANLIDILHKHPHPERVSLACGVLGWEGAEFAVFEGLGRLSF